MPAAANLFSVKTMLLKQFRQDYHEMTEPLKDFYANLGKLVIVEGQEEVADTTALVFKALED